jgi:hypothetical protein
MMVRPQPSITRSANRMKAEAYASGCSSHLDLDHGSPPTPIRHIVPRMMVDRTAVSRQVVRGR